MGCRRRSSLSLPAVQREEDHRKGLRALLLEQATVRGLDAALTVRGSSMLPLIRSGDLAHVRPGGDGRIRLGDVVALRSLPDGHLVIHRVVAHDGPRFVLRGDNCPGADGCYAWEDIIGVVKRIKRDGRNVWFGGGLLGGAVAAFVRVGLVWRVNRVVVALGTRMGRA